MFCIFLIDLICRNVQNYISTDRNHELTLDFACFFCYNKHSEKHMLTRKKRFSHTPAIRPAKLEGKKVQLRQSTQRSKQL